MQGDDYRHVSEWIGHVEVAAELGLSLTPDTATRSIVIEEAGLKGATAVGNVKIERLSAWLHGFQAAGEVAARRSARE